jgi:hypothetical protein
MFVYAILENIYVSYPRFPDEALGRVVPHKAKSVIVYVTQTESTIIHIVVGILIVSSVLTLISLILNVWRPLQNET